MQHETVKLRLPPGAAAFRQRLRLPGGVRCGRCGKRVAMRVLSQDHLVRTVVVCRDGHEVAAMSAHQMLSGSLLKRRLEYERVRVDNRWTGHFSVRVQLPGLTDRLRLWPTASLFDMVQVAGDGALVLRDVPRAPDEDAQ